MKKGKEGEQTCLMISVERIQYFSFEPFLIGGVLRTPKNSVEAPLQTLVVERMQQNTQPSCTQSVDVVAVEVTYMPLCRYLLLDRHF
jgi:hypothetical protein